MVRIAALTLAMVVVALTGFTSVANAQVSGKGDVFNCNNCQVDARSDEKVSRQKAMQCVRQSAAQAVARFSVQGAPSGYELSKAKSTRAHVGKKYDVIKNVDFKALHFYPDHHSGFELNEIPCNNGMVGYVACKNCIEGGNY